MRQSNIRPFGAMPDGAPVEEITLAGAGITAAIITYGGAVRSLTVPDRTGAPTDVVLGFDTLEDYRVQDKYIGAIVGRCANRIAGGRFSLNGREYPLFVNNGPNHLHGGQVGFDRQVWTVEELRENEAVLRLVSPDGQEGYPGRLEVRVTYTLEEKSLSIFYEARSDADTVCSLTNHSYFNLSGQGRGDVLDHRIQLCAQYYTPADRQSIPTGQLAPVEGTPMDLRQPVQIGARIGGDFPQLLWAGGYDHNWAVDGQPGQLRPAGRAAAPDTGIAMEVETTMPGIQFYTGNFLAGCPAGKGGARYENRSGFALETQFYPDAVHHPGFPSPVLRAGERYAHRTVYRFGLD